MKETKVTTVPNGLKINFSQDIKKSEVIGMVERCQNGQCECMSDAQKAKIENISVEGDNDNVSIRIETKELTSQDIESALSKSPLCCS